MGNVRKITIVTDMFHVALHATANYAISQQVESYCQQAAEKWKPLLKYFTKFN